MSARTAITAGLIVFSSVLLLSRAHAQDRATYVKQYEDPVLRDMRQANKRRREQQRAVDSAITRVETEAAKTRKRARPTLLFDLRGVEIPKGRSGFKQVFHQPPVPQFLTGTCWAFSSTSYFESEIYRLHKRKIKLSEMHTVYYEYLEKARRYVRLRGHSAFGQGSENNATVRIFRRYGALPASVYPGIGPGRRGHGQPAGAHAKRHDHSALFKDLSRYLRGLKKSGAWNEALNLAQVRVILNHHLGRPPRSFDFEGKRHTAKTFFASLGLNLNDYVEIMSTMAQPFWRAGQLDVKDNWWHSREYHNVPLVHFYRLIKSSLQRGYSVAIGGDVSEPGKNPFLDAAVVPSYDIPQEYINQHSREYRIYSKATTDDHGVHIVGYRRHAGRDWFLIKDSGRSARWGKVRGYYFFRDDYIRLKMLTATVHRDIFRQVAHRFRVAR